MAVALIAVRDQLRRLLSLQDHLSLKSDTDQGLRLKKRGAAWAMPGAMLNQGPFSRRAPQ